MFIYIIVGSKEILRLLFDKKNYTNTGIYLNIFSIRLFLMGIP